MHHSEYVILNEGTGFALYRRLDPGEERWYMDELHRLKKDGKDIWLHLKSNVNRVELEDFKRKLSK